MLCGTLSSILLPCDYHVQSTSLYFMTLRRRSYELEETCDHWFYLELLLCGWISLANNPRGSNASVPLVRALGPGAGRTLQPL